MADQVIWGIHMMAEGDHLAREQSYIGIGWDQLGDLRRLPATREAFKAAIAKSMPEKSPGYVINAGSQLFRFLHEMRVGEWVVYRSKIDRQYYVGQIAAEYEFRPDLDRTYPNVHKVKWIGTVSPTSVSAGARSEHGSALTLYQQKNYGDEFVRAVQGEEVQPEAEEDETVALIAEEVEQTTEDFVLSELEKHLKGHQFEGFLADLLRTMGYRTVGNRPGPDEGVDLLAYRDELRLVAPIIKVQAKSGHGQVGRPKVQELFGTLSHGEYGLFVSLGGFVAQAKDWAKPRSNLRLVDGPALVELVLEHYEDLLPKYKAFIPLKRVYIPQPAEGI